jgi:hypothetical protein
MKHIKRWVGVVVLGVLVGGLVLADHPGGSHLVQVGPVHPAHGFPIWYKDANGLSAELCLEARNPLCGFLPGDVPNPDAPLTVPGNFPEEAFWMLAGSTMNTRGGGRATLTLALEAAFAGGPVAAGDQMSFGRIRIRVDNPRPGATYRVIHPYGVNVFTGVEGGTRGIDFTQDIGSGDFADALESHIGPFLTWSPPSSAPAGFFGDPNVPHAITGSPFGTNVFRIEGPDIGDPGSPFLCSPPATDCIQTALFSLMGKRATLAGVGPLRATYSRTVSGGTLDVFAFSQPAQSIQVRSPGFSTTPMGGSPDGSYFARIPLGSGPLPTGITLVNLTDEPDTVVSIQPVDLVSITRAEYDLATRELRIAARSSDEVEPPVLTAEGWGVLTGGSLVRTGVSVPPPFITVRSSRGGSATLPVLVLGPGAPVPVVANAGPDQSVQQGQPVTLSGAGSSGNITGFSWRQTAGTPVVLTGATTSTATFTAPGTSGALAFELTVSGPGGTSVDAVTVQVLAGAPPVANAGPDQRVVQGRAVTLDATASTGATRFQWRQLSGVPVTLTGADTARPGFTFPRQNTVLVFELTVSGPGGTATDTVQVTNIQDTLTVTRAEFSLARREWLIEGTATVVGPGNTLTLHLGPTLADPVLGSVTVDARGLWSFRQREPTRRPNATQTVSIESSAGGQLLRVSVPVR